VRLHEFEGKGLFVEHGLRVPRGETVDSPVEAARAAAELGGEVVVKAQVLVGGRGKAGGIHMAADADEAGRAARELLAARIRGERPQAVLVEERLVIVRELYLGVTVDGAAGQPAALVGAMGGVDVETQSASDPAAMASAHLDPLASSMSTDQSRALAREAGLEGDLATGVAEVLRQLVDVFSAHQALQAEINPLALLADGSLVAADAVVELDDVVAVGQPRWSDRAAAEASGRVEVDGGMTYVEVDGDIGLICSGAGLGMATMDLVSETARPANFLETGGGITRQLMAKAMQRVLTQKGLRGILINVYGGINPIHEGALGVADVMAAGVEIPVVAKALGHRQEETWEILRAAGVTVVEALDTEAAVAEVTRLAGEGGA